MCGILGIVGRDATTLMVDGLRRLEYRGYDSAGIAILSATGLSVHRAVGPVDALAALPMPAGGVGIGHTRWATHGPPSERNAHPHRDCSSRIALVHNGVIENHKALRAALEAAGHVFSSDTDTEVLPHLIEDQMGDDLAVAVRAGLRGVRGSYALAVVSQAHPDMIVAARRKSPLLVGLGEGQTFLASDAAAILPHTRRVVFLEDDDVAEITAEGVWLVTAEGKRHQPVPQELAPALVHAQPSQHEHHMLREILEIPDALRALLAGRLETLGGRFDVEGRLDEGVLRAARRIVVVACGTSHYAGLMGKSMLEELAGIAVEVHLASEFRYAPFVHAEGTLAVFISQSGETADTLEAMRKAKAEGVPTLAFVNVPSSSLARESDGVFHLRAGPEIGVASTKALANTLGAFYLLALHLALARGSLAAEGVAARIDELQSIPDAVERVIARSDEIRAIGEEHFDGATDAFFLGRQVAHGLALEAALKLKEISYLHAEGYAAGELKHGPLALLVKGTPVTALVPPDEPSHAVMLSNVMEVKARGARVLGLFAEGDDEARDAVDVAFALPATSALLYPIPACAALYLLAYHVARARGCEIDKPRNLAKSVTVE